MLNESSFGWNQLSLIALPTPCFFFFVPPPEDAPLQTEIKSTHNNKNWIHWKYHSIRYDIVSIFLPKVRKPAHAILHAPKYEAEKFSLFLLFNYLLFTLTSMYDFRQTAGWLLYYNQQNIGTRIWYLGWIFTDVVAFSFFPTKTYPLMKTHSMDSIISIGFEITITSYHWDRSAVLCSWLPHGDTHAAFVLCDFY